MSGRNVQSSPSKRKSQREEGMPGIMISTERIRERSVMSATIRTHTTKAEPLSVPRKLKGAYGLVSATRNPLGLFRAADPRTRVQKVWGRD